MKIQERTPLHWPEGFPRTKAPSESKFEKHTVSEALNVLTAELERLRADDVVITANGYFRSQPVDKGVAVYFKLSAGWDSKKNQTIWKNYVMPCDKWNKIEHNFWAVAKHIEAMRGQQRWGVGSLERDFMGYTALPEKTSLSGVWYEVLGVSSSASLDQIKTAYRDKSKLWHPDTQGGSNEKMVALNHAYEQALALHKMPK